MDPMVRSVPGVVDDVWTMDRLPDLLQESEFVAIAAPHTPDTAGMFGTAQFGLMKPSAYLINIGRGVIVKLDELVQALRDDEIAGAALDVFETEPLPTDHPSWKMDNVIHRRPISRPLLHAWRNVTSQHSRRTCVALPRVKSR